MLPLYFGRLWEVLRHNAAFFATEGNLKIGPKFVANRTPSARKVTSGTPLRCICNHSPCTAIFDFFEQFCENSEKFNFWWSGGVPYFPLQDPPDSMGSTIWSFHIKGAQLRTRRRPRGCALTFQKLHTKGNTDLFFRGWGGHRKGNFSEIC